MSETNVRVYQERARRVMALDALDRQSQITFGQALPFPKKDADVQFEVFIVFPQPYVLIEGLYCSLTFWDKACPMLSLLHWCVWGNVYHKTLALECKSPQL